MYTSLHPSFPIKLELMFMKHYAPNRKFKKKKKIGGGGGGGGSGWGVRVDVNEELKFL